MKGRSELSLELLYEDPSSILVIINNISKETLKLSELQDEIKNTIEYWYDNDRFVISKYYSIEDIENKLPIETKNNYIDIVNDLKDKINALDDTKPILQNIFTI